jgi:CBS domain containing-hemolysin-like protein
MALDILLTFFLVFLNAFFVAAEFSIVKVRYSQIELKANQGNRFAKQSIKIINKLDTYLSANQLGITLASLGLGWIGEPVVAKVISSIVHSLNLNVTEETIHQISLPLGFFIITVLHIVFGELVPKSIAIRKPEKTTLFVSYPLKCFYEIFRPFIWLMNATSNGFLHIIGIPPAGDHETHSVEELRLLVQQSKDGGVIEEDNYEIIKNAFEFNDRSAKEIMVPRQQIFAVSIDMTLSEIIPQILENGYSRIPVYSGGLDNLLGSVHSKEIFKHYYNNPDFLLKNIIQPIYYIIESKKISDILKEFQTKHIHLGVVIDEFGGVEGILAMEDILEELVGEIQDEDDNERPIVEPSENNSFIIQATQQLVDINEHLPFQFPISEEYNSLSGYILFHLNRIPKANEKINIQKFEITIIKLVQRTIQVVKVVHVNPHDRELKPNEVTEIV